LGNAGNGRVAVGSSSCIRSIATNRYAICAISGSGRSAIQSSWTNGCCLSCQRTFRVYPRGVSAAQQSSNLKALNVLLYVLGLSYQGVSDLLDALGQPVSKSTAYNNVQAAGAEAILCWLPLSSASI
jgi:hypothetical protein